ncbi:DegT/DnrJ/EryC1/StrS family aminotransferase [Streptomyces sp. NPDC079020]|uniref:DegT/DnrJ/EryC1/StrS family aminotransferase n=1 Tax=Streptomyces sp. NPDC079020 TaxID=3365722 RepID=UPI0037D1FD81
MSSGVGNGTDALVVALKAAGVGPGDEVITAANSFIATAEAIVLAGATPVLVDVDPITFNIDHELVAGAVTERTAAVIPVYLYGRPVDLTPLLALAEQHGFTAIEDAAQGHGAQHDGRRAGSIGAPRVLQLLPDQESGCIRRCRCRGHQRSRTRRSGTEVA